jgi:hypothetical protein
MSIPISKTAVRGLQGDCGGVGSGGYPIVPSIVPRIIIIRGTERGGGYIPSYLKGGFVNPPMFRLSSRTAMGFTLTDS